MSDFWKKHGLALVVGAATIGAGVYFYDKGVNKANGNLSQTLNGLEERDEQHQKSKFALKQSK